VSASLLVIGGTGTLGRALAARAPGAGLAVTATRHRTPGELPYLDVTNASSVRSLIGKLRPGIVITTAYQPRGPAMWEVNGEGAGHVAAAARTVGARTIHLSSDLVFDGGLEPGRAYAEDDPAEPVLAYGASKLRGERAVLAADPTALVVRTSLIYGGDRLTATERLVLDAADGRSQTAFFSDEVRSPVEVGDLAGALLELATGGRAGLLHLAGPERIDRHSFAVLIARAHGRDPSALRAVRSADLPQWRPRNCALDSSVGYELLRRPPRPAAEVLLPSAAQAPG